jgi:putative transposase
MARLGGLIRLLHGREPLPSMVIIDAQTVKGGRYGPTYHQPGGRGGRTIGAKRTVLVEILGLPLAAHVESARPHDVRAGRELIHEALPRQPRVSDVLADRGYRGLVKAAEQHGARLVIKAPPAGQKGFTPIAPLYKVEHAFAQLGRWRRLSRCFEGTTASARAWLEVACLGYLFGRL